MIDLTLIPDGGLSWLDASGPMSNIVLSTRVRLARNLAGFPFAVRGGEEDRRRILDQVDRVWQRSPLSKGGMRFLVDDLEPADRLLLHERHLISKELASASGNGGGKSHAAVYLAGPLGLMVNEEDHLRLQVFHSASRWGRRTPIWSAWIASSGPRFPSPSTRSLAILRPVRPTPERGCGPRS